MAASEPWDPSLPSPDDRDPRRVRALFDSIAPRYDLLNHVLSLNIDRSWRRAAARALPVDPSARVLDLCGGTGDLSIVLARDRRAGLVVCCDFAHVMLARAGEKIRKRRLRDRCVLVEADGSRLPFRDGSFDAVTIGFGIRNFESLERGLAEMARVLRTGGRLVVLEFSRPTGTWLARLYRFYLGRILPRVGDRVSGRRGPYGYLHRTISRFDDPETLAGRIRESGFAAVGWTPLTGGIACVHIAIRGDQPISFS